MLDYIPSNLEAEQLVIGALLYNNLLYEKIAFLKKEHFYYKINQEIFEIILKFISKGSLASPITIAPIFKDNEIIKEAGGGEYWVNLVTNIGPIANITSNAQYVYELFLRRSMINISTDCIEVCQKFSADTSIKSIIDDTELKIFQLQNMENNIQTHTFQFVLEEVVKKAYDASQQHSLIGITSGLEKVDQHLGGFHKSDLIILAGRPSMGKTALVTSFAFNAAKQACTKLGSKVCFFSLEMSAEQLGLRILGQEANISSDRIRKGIISQKEFEKISSISKELYDVPLFIDDTPALTMAGLRTRARRLMKKEQIGLIVIDYLQLLRSDKAGENRVQELSEITRGLKSLAKELNIPIIALSQLSRAVEQREDKKPQLADLRESGSIEQDADIVMFIYREAYYESRKKPQPGSEKMQEWQLKMSKINNLAELIIAKQRHGPIGSVTLFFDETTTAFSNLSSSEYI
ncbi:replicative DNA helicase [Alphaproteobacteria bacterium endosymbiont of Tiliacea citrago]|uniref:replicative DNA helicase n=1 Tax=Alphaproteobacteria bacterium endosymbiont of Tiliacea citrago TaxID=3077944 RepID=UPI00313C0BA4